MKKSLADLVVPAHDMQTTDGEEVYNAEVFIRRLSFIAGVTVLEGAPRGYQVDIRHPDGAPWRRISAHVVCDPFGPQYVDVDGWEMYVCSCKAGGVDAAYRHTCHELRSDAEWIATAVERYLAVHPEKFVPELTSLVPRGCPS